jgi:hypothetical protein
MKYLITPVALCLLLAAGCTYQKGYKNIVEKDKFSIEVAGYLSKTRDLSTTPSLQYHNRFRTVYLLVDDTHKSTTKESFVQYHENALNGFRKIFGDIKVTVLPDTLLNGQKCILEEIVLKTDNEKVWYLLATIETEKNYYQVCSWTIEKRKEKYENDIRYMVTSFKEL